MDPNLVELLAELSEESGLELCFPGNWSPTLFLEDLRNYPLDQRIFGSSRRKLAEIIESACKLNTSYLSFFYKTRGFKRKKASNQALEGIWIIFERTGMMLYFEEIFLELLVRTNSRSIDRQILECMTRFSESSYKEWPIIAQSYGAFSLEMFCSDPIVYIRIKSGLRNPSKNLMDDFDLQKKYKISDEIMHSFSQRIQLITYLQG